MQRYRIGANTPIVEQCMTKGVVDECKGRLLVRSISVKETSDRETERIVEVLRVLGLIHRVKSSDNG